MQRLQGWAEQGNTTVTVSGAGDSTTKFQGSFPACTVTVYRSGTVSIASIYSDNGVTPKANPFTAGTDGSWYFYAANGEYDVKFSGTGITTPFTLGAFMLFDEQDLWFNVKDSEFNAKGDGSTDDTLAIQAAINAAYSAGGGTVFIPRGTYILGTMSVEADAHNSLLTPKNKVNIVGDGMGVTILKIKSGMNAAYPALNKPNVISTIQALPLESCRFADFTIDWNGANNLLTAGMSTRNNAGIMSRYGGKNIIVERVEIKETPGNQCVFFPAVADQGEGYITVRDCIFRNNGSGLTGNYNTDHSSIYCNGDYLLYQNNYFTADNAVKGSCYEIHGSHSTAIGNKSYNYERGFWIVPNYKAISNVTVTNDVHIDTELAFQIASITFASNNIKISDCTFIQRTGLTPAATAYFVNGNTIISCDSLQITGCRFMGQGYTMRFLQIFAMNSLKFVNNHVSGFAGYGILYGASYAAPIIMDYLLIEHNVFSNVTYAIYAFSATDNIPHINISNNAFNYSASHGSSAINLNIASGSGYVRGNIFHTNYTAPYGALPAGVLRDHTTIYDVMDYGAVGNGTTVEDTAITAAIAAMPAAGGTLYFPRGKYLISTKFTFSKKVRMVGDGCAEQTNQIGATMIYKDDAMADTLIELAEESCSIEDIAFQGQTGNTGNGIVLAATGCTMRNVSVNGMGNDGVRIGKDDSTVVVGCNLDKIIARYNGGHGIYIHSNDGQALPTATTNTLVNLYLTNNTDSGIEINNSWYNTVIGVFAQANSKYGIELTSGGSPNYYGARHNTIIGGDQNEGNSSGEVINNGYRNIFIGTDYTDFTNNDPYCAFTGSSNSIVPGLMPSLDNFFYLGKNDDDSPLAWKGVILKDTTNGKYYRIEVISGVVTATDLTD